MTFRPDLQGLRALAVLLVIGQHAGWSLLPGGFVGVDVFFVLSGYLISGLLLKELDGGGRIGFAAFYARRLRRLLPALAVMLAATGLAAWALLSPSEVGAQLAMAPFAATWTSNLVYAFNANGYFDELAARDLLVHTWSLGVEEQFYLLWPVLLWALYRSGARRGLELGLVLLFLSSLALSLFLSVSHPQSAFYMMPARIWEFALGALVYRVVREDHAVVGVWLSRLGGRARTLMRGLGVLLILGSALSFRQFADYPGFWALVPAFGAALVMLAGQGAHRSKSLLLANPAAVWVGNVSYSWYLWHWPVLTLGFSLGFEGQLWPTLGLLLVSLLAAALSYRFVELPFWKGRFSRGAPRPVILLGVLLMVALASAALVGLRALPQAPAKGFSQHRGDLPAIYGMGCDAWFANADVRPCGFGVPAAPKTVVMLGDSVGLQWFSAVRGAFPEPEWRMIVLTKSSCPMVDEPIFYGRIGKIYQVCDAWRDEAIARLPSLRPDVIVIGSAATYAYSEAQWVDGSARIMARLGAMARHVFVIPGTPSLPFDGPGCAERNLLADGRVDRGACLAAERLKIVAPVSGYLARAAEAYPNVHVLDLNDLVCPRGECAAVSEEGALVFRDSQHLTNSFVLSLQTEITDRFARAMPTK